MFLEAGTTGGKEGLSNERRDPRRKGVYVPERGKNP